VVLYTQYTYEKKWTKTSEKEALLMINEEMPETDAVGTLAYILAEITKGKTGVLEISCQSDKILSRTDNERRNRI
jgi:hypothetical protein